MRTCDSGEGAFGGGVAGVARSRSENGGRKEDGGTEGIGVASNRSTDGILGAPGGSIMGGRGCEKFG